ncbi:hypothetical protein J2128_001416 [Methanomicrobium sp. W14]|uniref:hypothetical protein n=1 Tax=Methanomicrobium sp. W14 TaxID=2817839 RepID=UPI001AE11176|nr:hypothetical protein [Methanomicrobium sp. W14]MBP2133462.1 hypothetical protein [Methanomicrobium sp. W14]
MQEKEEKSTDEAMWKISSDFAGYMPQAFDDEIRKISAGKYDAKIKDAELKIFREAGKKGKKYATYLNLPLDNALEVAEAFRMINSAITGPETESETMKGKGDTAKITIKKCPICSKSLETGTDRRIVYEMCMNFAGSAVENLNPAYKLVFQKSICNCDSLCEMIVVRRYA